MTRSPLFKLFSLFALAIVALPNAVSAQEAAAPTITERFDDWVLSCMTAENGDEVCEIRQVLLTSADNRLVAALALSNRSGAYSLLGIVPLGTRLQAAPTIAVDDSANATSGTYVQCLGSGCRVMFPLTNSTVDEMGRGENVRITLTRPNGTPIGIGFSLKGFTAARNALDARS